MRVGIGYDVHPLVRGRRLVLGGIEIPFNNGLDGHSDADVLVHAIIDALLGAAGLGDIGSHFPPEARYKDISSINLLRQVMTLLRAHGWQVNNVDATVVAGGEEGGEGLAQAVKITKPGGSIGNVAHFSSGDVLPIPRLKWGAGLGHKTIRGGLMPGGRLRLERLIDMVRYKRVDPSRLVTHKFKGMENLEKAWNLMRAKPGDLIKPVVVY